MQRITRTSLVMLGVALTGAGCQELQVDNPNAPDRDRAVRNAADVENIIAGAFPTVWNPLHDYASAAMLWSAWGQEGATTSQVGGIWQAATQQPVQPLINLSTINESTGPIGPRQGWLDFHRAVSAANDGLAAMADGIEMPTAVETERAKAFAYFIRGVAWGHLATGWAQGTVLTEDIVFGSDPLENAALVRANMKAYPEVLEAALASLTRAAEIASANNFSIPVEWFRTAEPVTSAQLVRIANSYKAKFMVYTARSPEERAGAGTVYNVDWDEVLRLTASGVTSDFAPTASPVSGGLVTDYIRQSQLNSRNGLQQSRADYELIGPADVSGNWQEYAATELFQRNKILITSPDRRVQGPDGPTSNGSYFRFVINPNSLPDTDYGFISSRGLYNFSNYQWYRYGGAFTNIQVPLMGVDENRLIRAEALLRTGDLEGAAQLINVTRTRAQRIGNETFPTNLPPVTGAGVPEGDSCVPKTRTGACGSLLDALAYERRIELYGVDGLRPFVDARGFGLLREGTPVHMPIPGREIEALGLQQYTFGGVGGNCAWGSGVCNLPEIN